MLFSPTTLIMASRLQQQHVAGVRLDGHTTVSKSRRRGFLSGDRSRTVRPTPTGRSLATA
ncbi:MAG: hypothetical protein ABJD68_17735 [Nakamurella sp.]